MSNVKQESANYGNRGNRYGTVIEALSVSNPRLKRISISFFVLASVLKNEFDLRFSFLVFGWLVIEKQI